MEQMRRKKTGHFGPVRFALRGPVSGSVIIHHFAIKSPFFMSLGACRLKRRILVLVVGLWTSLGFISCGSSPPKNPASGLKNRVLASQGVTSTFTFGALVILNGSNDTIPANSRLSGGSS